MNKLISLLIINKTLFFEFENGGYIKLTNLSNFDYQIKNCNSDINYLRFFSSELRDYQFICASNGKAILININFFETYDFQPDNDDDWHNKLHQNISNFLKNNFIIYNVEECNTNQETEYFKLSNVFDEIKKEEIEKTTEKNEVFIKENIDQILNKIKTCLKNDEFNLIATYIMYNHDFLVLKNNLQIKPSLSLKQAIRNYVENEITKIFKKYKLDISLFNINLIKKFCPPLKSKRLTYKVEAEQIGRDHEKRWQISNFSFNN